MLQKAGELIANISAYFFPAGENMSDRRDDYCRLVGQARREWQGAKHRFDQISDPALIDHAIFAIEAAERRYMYLLQKAREEGITLYAHQQEVTKPPLQGKE